MRLLSLLSNEEDKKRQLQTENQKLRKCISDLKCKLNQANARERQKDICIDRMINEHKAETEKFKNINLKHQAETALEFKEKKENKKKIEALKLELTLLRKKYNELEISKKN